jgi:hypothetical protein
MRVFVLGGVTCPDDDPRFEEEKQQLSNACRRIGAELANRGHDILVCSPFEDSADVEVLSGVAKSGAGPNTRVEFHFVDAPLVREKIEGLVRNLGLMNVSRVPYPPPRDDSREGRQFAWLLCQLHALEACHATVAIGGDPDGASNMLLLLAEGKRKPVVPFAFMGGAAGRAFVRRRYELEDRLGKRFVELQDPSQCESVVEIAELLAASPVSAPGMHGSSHLPMIFISYPRARPTEADYAEILLRRRGLPVYRDESDFGAGHSIPTEITEKIHSSEIFLAMWCKEYACSPWCYDEFELAPDRHEAGKLNLWIFLLDDTRIVPRRARDLNAFPTKTREALEGKLLELLARVLVQET